MTCAGCRPLLEAHLDGELDARSSLEVEEHLAGCAGCRAAFDELRALQALVRGRAPRYEAPPRLLRPARPRALPWVAAGAVLAAAAGVALVVLPGADRGLEEALADAHVRALEPGHGPDVVSSDHHVVVPWFAGRLPYAVIAPDLAAGGFPLLGGRIDVVRGRRVAALTYGHGRHLVSVFLWPEAGGDEVPRRAPAVRGYRPVTWRTAGLRFWALSDAAPGELEALGAAFAR